MYHGEDLAKHAAAQAVIGGGQRAYGDGQSEVSIRAVRQMATVPGLIAQAAETQKYAADRAVSLDGLAGRALDIATRLTGSFPTPAPAGLNAKGGDSPDGPGSALDALQITIGGIRRPLSAMDDGFNRLAAALEAIERALN